MPCVFQAFAGNWAVFRNGFSLAWIRIRRSLMGQSARGLTAVGQTLLLPPAVTGSRRFMGYAMLMLSQGSIYGWMEQGLDFGHMLPYLSKFLGHKSYSDTHYYYHYVEAAARTIRKKDTVVDRVVPEVMRR